MANYKTLEKGIDKEFKELLLNMDSKEFNEYFKKLIEKYYSTLFSYEDNYNKYVEDTAKRYNIIKTVKNLLKWKYNNLDNFENYLRLEQAEKIAYEEMIELHFMEKSYSNLIYNNATQELIIINENLTDLKKLYEKNPSEDLLSIIGNTLKRTVILLKEIKKLPLNEGTIEDYKVAVEIDIEHFKDLSDEDKKELPETLEFSTFKIPILSFYLKQQLEKFEDLLQELKKILPEDVIADFETELYSSEKLDFIKLMLNFNPENQSEEEIYKTVAYIDYIKNSNNKGYLYEILDRWD